MIQPRGRSTRCHNMHKTTFFPLDISQIVTTRHAKLNILKVKMYLEGSARLPFEGLDQVREFIK